MSISIFEPGVDDIVEIEVSDDDIHTGVADQIFQRFGFYATQAIAMDRSYNKRSVVAKFSIDPNQEW